MNIGMNVWIKGPVLRRKFEVAALGLSPYRPQLCGDYKSRDVEKKMRQRKTIALVDHDGITSEHRHGCKNEWRGSERARGELERDKRPKRWTRSQE